MPHLQTPADMPAATSGEAPLNSAAHLRARLLQRERAHPGFWSFRSICTRRHVHDFFQYPAMMVPDVMAQLLEDICATVPGIRRVFDPFMGSGTVLTEAMLLGLDFCGRDINPLAVLLARAKAWPRGSGRLDADIVATVERAGADRSCAIETGFPGLDKWFHPEVQVSLSGLTRAIRAQRNQRVRRFLWVALAETVRVTSNSRISTVKLHVRPEAERSVVRLDPIAEFGRISRRNAGHLGTLRDRLAEAGRLTPRGCYDHRVDVGWGDATAPPGPARRGRFDLLVTSPPYGDNPSTVTYGQHAFLPLQWIDWKDIDARLNPGELLASTHTIDTRSLGGSRKGAANVVEALAQRSASFAACIQRLRGHPRDRWVRVTAFVRDLNRSLAALVPQVRPGGYLLWVVGNRTVGGGEVPLDAILRELLEQHGTSFVCQLDRNIRSKRMAHRNGISSTMTREKLLVMRRTDAFAEAS